MRLTDLDYLAVHGQSWLHRASPPGKLVFAAMATTAILLAHRVERLSVILTLLVMALAVSGVELKTTLHLLSAPALFAAVCTLVIRDIGMLTRLAILLRAVATTGVMLLLISTTSISDLSAYAGRLLSPAVADALLMTCRSTFLLAGRLSNLIVATRVKGIATPGRIPANLGPMGGALAAALLRCLDLSERMRRIMVLRGYTPGSLIPSKRQVTWWDAAPLAAGAITLGVALW